jgi:hypothetical protein
VGAIIRGFRGGIKLAHAIKHFELDPTGVTAMDIGSSTGGFTVLLTHGAERVFAVDPAPINWRGNCARTRASPFWNRHRRAS